MFEFFVSTFYNQVYIFGNIFYFIINVTPVLLFLYFVAAAFEKIF